MDQLTKKIHVTGLGVIQITAKSRKALGSSIPPLTLHQQVAKNTSHIGLRKLIQLDNEQEQLSSNNEKKHKILIKQREREILDAAADVVCCACIGAGNPRLVKLKFRMVLINEATQAAEPGCRYLSVCDFPTHWILFLEYI